MKTTEAVKSVAEITRVAELLEKHGNGSTIYRDVWTFGIQAALRISDLLEVTMEQALSGVLILQEGKTKKTRTITLNATARAVVARRAAANPSHEWLFQVNSNRAANKPISRISVSRKFKEIGDIVGIHLNTHSMRKTLGYAMHSQGAPIERIAKVLNHSSPATTMHYIGLTEADTQAAYSEFEIVI